MGPSIDYITVKGFRSLKSIEKLALRPVNVVIGPNGCGKSNFINVFSFIHALCEAKLKEYVGEAGGADRILYFGSKETHEIYMKVSFRGEVYQQYEITLAPTVEDSLRIISENVISWDKSRLSTECECLKTKDGEAGISGTYMRGVTNPIQQSLESWRIYHFHDTSPFSPMRKVADLDDNRFLRSDGENLPALLYLLKEKHGDEYELIRKTIQQVTPFFDDFILKPSLLNESKIKLEWKHKGTDKYFDVSSLSDGTLRFIALTVLFMQPEWFRPSIILIDEPELGLHPYAITKLASLIKSFSVHTQVIVTTQSALLLDHFEPEDILVAKREKDDTTFRRLESKELESWLADYSLGQLWEKNQLGGRP